MINLAGVRDCDRFIACELSRAGIEAVLQPVPQWMFSEVPYLITGRLGQFEFKRAWYYWVVKGQVPLAVAEEMYADEMLRNEARAGGDAGCRPPETWAEYRTTDGTKILHAAFRTSWQRYMKAMPDLFTERVTFSDRPKDLADWAFVDTYHIDTQRALNGFVATLRRHGLEWSLRVLQTEC